MNWTSRWAGKTALAFCAFCLIGTGMAGAQGFLTGFEDLPLAPNLRAVEDTGLVFDSPAGRIVEGYATGDTNAAAVQEFYQETLPALGWIHEDGSRFRREGEQLVIDYFGSAGALSVRFTLAPL